MDNTDTIFLEQFREALKAVPTVTLTEDMVSPCQEINGIARTAVSRRVSPDDLSNLAQYFPSNVEISLYAALKIGAIVNEHGAIVEHSNRIVRYAQIERK